jgi:glycosyltransferase involved in cell wall biosynthesis
VVQVSDEIDVNAERRVPFLSCFFPAYNEAENIAEVLDEAVATLPAFADRFEVVVVDDGSTDGTANIVEDYAKRHPEVRLVSHDGNKGYGRAVRTGLESCRGDAVFFTDADHQFQLADLARMIPVFEGADLVAGYRLERSDPWHRLLVAKVYKRALRLMFGVRFLDVDCAFKLFRRNVLEAIVPELRSRSAFTSPEIMIRASLAGFKVVEVGIPHYPRTAGTAKGATLKVITRTIREMFSLRGSVKSSGRHPAPATPPNEGSS